MGSIVKHCETTGDDFFTLPLETLQKFSGAFSEDVKDVLSPEGSPERKRSEGSTSKGEVKKQIAALRRMLEA